ncbi:MAG TPA: hypothetical protein VF485_07415 [Sphingomonas sp.]
MSRFDWLFAWLAPLWLATWIGASIVFRLNRGKPVYPKRPANSVYYEGWGSGRSLNTIWSRIGGASNCLIIAVTREQLVVSPRFPFNLGFLPEVYGLEVTAPLRRVQVEKAAAGMFRTHVLLSIDGEQSTRMQLKLRDRASFLAALTVA